MGPENKARLRKALKTTMDRNAFVMQEPLQALASVEVLDTDHFVALTRADGDTIATRVRKCYSKDRCAAAKSDGTFQQSARCETLERQGCQSTHRRIPAVADAL